MSLDALRETLPAYAKDLSLNLSSPGGRDLLTDQQKWGAFLASAYAVGAARVIAAVEAASAPAACRPRRPRPPTAAA